MNTRAQHGFTLLELLIVLVILGILVAIGTTSLTRWQRNVAAEDYVQNFASDMNLARTRTMSTGTVYRVVLNTPTQYVVQRQASSSWTTVTTRNASQSSIANTGAKTFLFSTRGFMTASDASGATTTSTNLTATLANGNTRTVIVTVLGLTRAF